MHFWIIGENSDECYWENLKSMWKLCTGTTWTNTWYKTFTLKAMKVSIHEKYYSFILRACKWHGLHPVSLYKHVNVSLSILAHSLCLPCLYTLQSTLVPFTQIHLTLFKAANTHLKGQPKNSRHQTINLHYSKSVLKRSYCLFLHVNCSQLLSRNLDTGFSGEKNIQEKNTRNRILFLLLFMLLKAAVS